METADFAVKRPESENKIEENKSTGCGRTRIVRANLLSIQNSDLITLYIYAICYAISRLLKVETNINNRITQNPGMLEALCSHARDINNKK